MAKKVVTKKSSARSAKTTVSPVPSENMQAQSSANVARIMQNVKKPQVLIPVIVIVILALLVYIFRSWFVVATVNGQIISRAELNTMMAQQYGKDTLNSLITKTLIVQEANKQNITVSQDEIDAALKQISDSLAKQGQTLDSVIAARGLKKQDVEDQVRVQKMAEKLVKNDVKVSDKDVQDYMDKNKDALPTGMTDDQLKQTVKQQLEQQQLNDKEQTLVADLQKKANITYVASF